MQVYAINVASMWITYVHVYVDTSTMMTADVMVMLPMLLTLCLATSVISLQDDINRKACPGCQSSCEDDQTCCLMLNGDWGCCTFPNVCQSLLFLVVL